MNFGRILLYDYNILSLGELLSRTQKEEAREWLDNKQEGFSLVAMAFQIKDKSFFPSSLLKDETLNNMSPVSWWELARSDRPDLISSKFFSLVENLMMLVASTAGIERWFSTMTNTITDKRNRLALEKATKIGFINKHL
jgi:hypothetical protein